MLISCGTVGVHLPGGLGRHDQCEHNPFQMHLTMSGSEFASSIQIGVVISPCTMKKLLQAGFRHFCKWCLGNHILLESRLIMTESLIISGLLRFCWD